MNFLPPNAAFVASCKTLKARPLFCITRTFYVYSSEGRDKLLLDREEFLKNKEITHRLLLGRPDLFPRCAATSELEGGGGIIIIIAWAAAGSNIEGMRAAAVRGLIIPPWEGYEKPNNSAICWVAAAVNREYTWGFGSEGVNTWKAWEL